MCCYGFSFFYWWSDFCRYQSCNSATIAIDTESKTHIVIAMKLIDLPRKILFLTLIGLNIGAYSIPPLLGSSDYQKGSFLESSHDPNLCGSGHDHSICLQYSTEKIFTSGAVYQHSDDYVSVAELDKHSSRTAFESSVLGHQDRAPPVS